MPEVTSKFATAVVIHEDGHRVLLHKREDFRVWALPGSSLDAGETPEQAAVRETKEENGYDIEVTNFVGEYHRPQLHDIRFVYCGFVVGGEPILRGSESLAVAWFSPHDLPKALFPSVREIVLESLDGAAYPVMKEESYPGWKISVYQGLIRLRNFRNRLVGRV
jgi:8-oxo-dGTP diphosphatase